MKRVTIAIAVTLLMASSTLALAQSAFKLNVRGQKLLKKKHPVEALQVFRQAHDLDPDLPSTHYNLARALAIIRQQGDICTHGAEKSRILRHLFKAVQSSRKYKRKARKDKAFASVRDTFGFQRLMGLSIRKSAQVKKLLQRISWYGPVLKDGRPGSGMKFSPNGTCRLWIRDPTGPDTEPKEISCTFRVQANLVQVNLSQPLGNVEKSNGALMETGELALADLPGPFSDDPHDCPQ